jgi:hypothetical protein
MLMFLSSLLLLDPMDKGPIHGRLPREMAGLTMRSIVFPELSAMKAPPRSICRMHRFPNRSKKPKISRMMGAQNPDDLL